MNPLRRALQTITSQAGKLGPTQRLLIASLGVIMVMTLFLVSQYAGKTAMVELLPAGTSEDVRLAAMNYAQDRGIAIKESGGALMVPPESRRMMLAGMNESGALSGDTSLLFSNIIEKQSWTNPKEINEQLYNVALQNELARTLAEFQGIKSATVVIDAPAPHGLGMAVRPPTAAVTVFTSGSSGLSQRLVDATAAFVSGAKAGLDITRVRVIDGSSGRQMRATSEEDLVASSYLEHAVKVEQQTKRKLDDLLSYIPGVLVAVTAEVDVTKRTTQTLRHLADGQGTVSMPLRDANTKITRASASNAARPGVQANTGADLDRGPSAGPEYEESDKDSEFENKFGSESINVVDPRGMPTRVAASVNIPAGYIAMLLTAATPEGEEVAAPDADAIDARFEIERARIRESLLPHLPRSVDADGASIVSGDVVVSLMPGEVLLAGAGAGGGGGGGAMALITGAGGAGPMGIGIDKIALFALAAVAVAMMIVTVKKAGQVHELPTAEELTGLPPALEHDSDMVGEAGDADAPMAGIELEESDVTGQQMLEQVRALVQSDPEFSSRLLKRWIQPD